MKNIQLITSLRYVLFGALALTTSAVQAEKIAITNATVYTVAEQGVLLQATVVIEGGKITAVYSKDDVPDSLNADTIIDAKGRILTPGFIATKNLLGLVEVGAVSDTRDGSDKKADLTFDASLAFNPKSSLIPYARKGGITSNLVMPHGGEKVFTGQSFVVNLSGEFDSVIVSQNAVIVSLGSTRKGSRAVKLQTLSNELEDAQKSLAKAEKAKAKKKKSQGKDKEDKEEKEEKEAKTPSRAEQVMYALLSGEKPLLAYADRATDILALLKIKQKYNLDLILVGASDAVLVSEEIAKAKVTVMMSAIDNLPTSFDSLHTSLANVAILSKAGVTVIITNSGESHNINQLRFDAGVAIANGLAETTALAAITANVADSFNLNSGRIVVGKNADLVLWSSDPFEISTKVDAMWINGNAMSLTSRQDALRQRYTADTDMPRAYTK
ncbi:amidohydrolase [Colwellia sp. MT41]|uniref:amidohydrolase family protein n=1 Tax=Colwellia sp. MT41 TaxID=58049 RepID=UPI0007178162|nr:amidohydrolase family protein [Colwellia sp. MT41]ALO35447.1 amidohydrolase [Colwellia sp. MT41]